MSKLLPAVGPQTGSSQSGVQIVTDGPEGKALPAPPLERQGQLMYLALRLGSPIFQHFQLGPTKTGVGKCPILGILDIT